MKNQTTSHKEEKRECPDCKAQINIQETGTEGKFRFATHNRVVPQGMGEEEGVHLRNVRDEVCPGSEKIIEQ